MAPKLMQSLPLERSECFGYQSRIDLRVTVMPRSARRSSDIAVAVTTRLKLKR